jgi:hypothetical protein
VLTGIDHLVLAAADPDRAAEELEQAVGLRSTGGGRHESMGTYNRLVWLGDSYLELIGVWDEALARGSWVGSPTVDALAAGRPFVTFSLGSDDLDGDVAAFRSLGGRWDGPIRGERTRPDGGLVRWSNAMPGQLGPDLPPFVIEHDSTGSEWTPAERASRAEAVHPIGAPVRLETLELMVSDVRPVGDRYLRALGLAFRPSLAGGGARDLSIGRQIVRLRRGVGPPVVRLHAPGVSGRDIEALGLRWVVRG